MNMIRVNKHLAIFSTVFVLLGVIALFIIQKLSPLINHVAYYCKSLMQTNMTPIPYFLNIVPALFILLILIASLVKFFFLTLKIKFTQYKLKGKITIGRRVNRLIKLLGLADKTVIIKSNKSFAFCLGVKSPKIYISTELLSKLTLKEIESVLRHEQYHLENHDTFTMIVASVTYSFIPFFPLFGDFIKNYQVNREIYADNFAVEKIGSSAYLISALKKLLKFPTAQNTIYAAIADHDTLEPRIYSLINKPYSRRQFRLKHLFITLFSIVVIATFIALPVNAKEIHQDKHDVLMVCTDGACMNSCTSYKSLDKLYSEIPNDKKISEPNSSQPYIPMH